MNTKRTALILTHLLDNGLRCKTESIPTSGSDDFKKFLQSMDEEGYIKAKIRKSKGTDDYGDPLDVVILSITEKSESIVL